MAEIRKLSPDHWESVADAGRWLLTHADEYEVVILVLREQARKRGDPESALEVRTFPPTPIIETVGALELAKLFYADQALPREEG